MSLGSAVKETMGHLRQKYEIYFIKLQLIDSVQLLYYT